MGHLVGFLNTSCIIRKYFPIASKEFMRRTYTCDAKSKDIVGICPFLKKITAGFLYGHPQSYRAWLYHLFPKYDHLLHEYHHLLQRLRYIVLFARYLRRKWFPTLLVFLRYPLGQTL